MSIATARELAKRDVREMDGRGDIYVLSHKYRTCSSNSCKDSNDSSNSKGNDSRNPCMGCENKHSRKDCHYKNVEGFECKTKGHIRAMCKKAQFTDYFL